jgi:hypothetical protein
MKWMCREQCSSDSRSVEGKGFTLLGSLLLLFVPKCALCWAAYMSFLGSIGIVIKYQPWFLPVAIILFVFTLVKLLIVSIRRRNFISFFLALAAGLLIVYERSEPGIDGIKIVAVIMMFVAITMEDLVRVMRAIQPKQAMEAEDKHR